MFFGVFIVVSMGNEISALLAPHHSNPRGYHHSSFLGNGRTPPNTSGSCSKPISFQRRPFVVKMSAIHSTAAAELNDDTRNINLPDQYTDDFQPRTMGVSESMIFFVRFVFQSIHENRAQRRLGRTNRRQLRHRLKKFLFRRKSRDSEEIVLPSTTLKQKELMKKSMKNIRLKTEDLSLNQSLRRLNESRKNLIRLVGYDSSLLVPAFGYLTLGAFMSSIIPHYYSACISCVAAGEPNKLKLIRSLCGLGVSHVLEALFTGFRGALFWIAGKSFFWIDFTNPKHPLHDVFYIFTNIMSTLWQKTKKELVPIIMLESNFIAIYSSKKPPFLILMKLDSFFLDSTMMSTKSEWSYLFMSTLSFVNWPNSSSVLSTFSKYNRS